MKKGNKKKVEVSKFARVESFRAGTLPFLLLAILIAAVGVLRLPEKLATVNLPTPDYSELFVEQLSERYTKATGVPSMVVQEPEFWLLQRLAEVGRRGYSSFPVSQRQAVVEQKIRPMMEKNAIAIFSIMDERIAGMECTLSPPGDGAPSNFVFGNFRPLKSFGLEGVDKDARVLPAYIFPAANVSNLFNTRGVNLDVVIQIEKWMRTSPFTGNRWGLPNFAEIVNYFVDRCKIETTTLVQSKQRKLGWLGLCLSICFVGLASVAEILAFRRFIGICVVPVNCSPKVFFRFIFSNSLVEFEKELLGPFEQKQQAEFQKKAGEKAIERINVKLRALLVVNGGAEFADQINSAVNSGMSINDREALYLQLKWEISSRHSVVNTQSKSCKQRDSVQRYLDLTKRCSEVVWQPQALVLYQEALGLQDILAKNEKLGEALRVQRSLERYLVLVSKTGTTTANGYPTSIGDLVEQVLPLAKVEELVVDTRKARVVWLVLLYLLNPGGGRRNFGESYKPITRLRPRIVGQMVGQIDSSVVDDTIDWMVREEVLLLTRKDKAMISINPHHRYRDDVGGNLVRLAKAAGYKLEDMRK